MPVDLDSFVATLEEMLPCSFIEIEPRALCTCLEGSGTRIRVDRDGLRLDVATPVEGADDGLPVEDLLALLEINFPGDFARDSFLAGGAAAGQLALTASLALGSTSAASACTAILDQIAASVALRDRIVGSRANRFNQGRPGNGI